VSSPKALRTTLTIVMDILVVIAIALTAGLVVQFFGSLAATSLGKAIVAITAPFTIPFGVQDIKTPYGGVFDVATALTIVLLLLIDWVLSVIRARA